MEILHDYVFNENGCWDQVTNDATWQCDLNNGAYIQNKNLVLTSDNSYAQLPSNILGENPTNISIELSVSTGGNNIGWTRIIQFGSNQKNNANSFALDRIASNYNNNHHPYKIMLEYFPSNFPTADNVKFQAYSNVTFNNQDHLYIVILIAIGQPVVLYINSVKFESVKEIPIEILSTTPSLAN